jgi:hypothetical protein
MKARPPPSGFKSFLERETRLSNSARNSSQLAAFALQQNEAVITIPSAMNPNYVYNRNKYVEKNTISRNLGIFREIRFIQFDVSDPFCARD